MLLNFDMKPELSLIPQQRDSSSLIMPTQHVAQVVYARCVIRSAFSHEHVSQNNCIWGVQLSIVFGYDFANYRAEKLSEADGLFIVFLNMVVCLLDIVILLGFKQTLV